MLVVRTRWFKTRRFCEYLVIAKSKVLKLPDFLPVRYKSRVLSEHKIEGTTLVVVDSNASESAEFVSKRSIHEGLGVWLVADDFYSKGGFIDEVKPVVQFMSVEIFGQDAQIVVKHCEHISYLLNAHEKPMSLYHGSSAANIHSILKYGLRPSFGMLGVATYFGTLWKAARFACLTQDYLFQEGAIFRCVCFSSKPCEFPRDGWKCECEACIKSSWSSSIADHTNKWCFVSDCAHANIVPAGLKYDGTTKYLLRNEEWAFKEGADIMLTHYAEMDPASMSTANYMPLSRSARIK